jgi:hypothetical protein
MIRPSRILLMAALSLIMSALPAVNVQAQTPAQLQSEILPSVAALQKQITALQVTVAAMQKQTATTQTTDTAQAASLAAVQRQVTLIAQNPALKLGPFVSIATSPVNGVASPTVVLSGCNLQLVNGMGQTGLTNSLGNMIVGYCEVPYTGLQPGDRSGSHNLVVGLRNLFTTSAYGSVVFGQGNGVGWPSSSVLGGNGNGAGLNSVVVGGFNNAAIGQGSVIVGGGGNKTAQQGSVIVSGSNNYASGVATVILGGTNNVADGSGSMVVSGENNFDGVLGTTILGGNGVFFPQSYTGAGPVNSGPITIVAPVQQ